VNCSQAREMLSAYRELKNDDQDKTALDVHLANCADCRQQLDRYNLVGTHIRSLPAIEPSSQAYTNLMRALAVEHARFIQRSSSSSGTLTPAPDFLKPYLKEHAAKDPATEALAAFSKADTGPLPVIRAVPERSRGLHLNHFAIIGLAAAFLLVLMTGGITSVLWLAQSHQSPGPAAGAGSNITSVQRVSQVTMVSAATTTSYPHVVSAVASRQDIYYSAYGETNSEWMLEQLDMQTHQSTPLLPTASTSPLIVLGSSQNQLVWLQFDPAQPVKNSKKQQAHGAETSYVRPWTLYSLALNTDQTDTQTQPTPQILLQGTFDQKTAPSWVHTPVQGLWFTQDTLLITSIDQKGISHLVEHQFSNTITGNQNSKDTKTQSDKKATTTELASANNGHILTSPTANSDGTSIYWSDEWLSEDNTLHSNIWTQQTGKVAPVHGKWILRPETEQFQFTDDDKSFRPQVVNDTLFLIQAATTDVTNQLQLTPTATAAMSTTPTTTATVTSGATVTATVTASATATGESGNIAQVDPNIYSQPLDASIQGTLQAFSINTGAKLSPAFGADGPISALQAGGRFLIWQNSNNNSFDMFDVTANIPVNINPTIVPKDAIFLAVNGDSAVWISNADINTDQNDITNSTVKFGTFNWPPPKTSARTTP
jgi:hypothetical protein